MHKKCRKTNESVGKLMVMIVTGTRNFTPGKVNVERKEVEGGGGETNKPTLAFIVHQSPYATAPCQHHATQNPRRRWIILERDTIITSNLTRCHI